MRRRTLLFRYKKVYTIIGLVLLFLTITVGYAYLEKILSTNININVAKYQKPILTVQDLVNRANAASATYTGVSEEQRKEMFAFEHEATANTPQLIDYRYIGNIPNNYINFNNETWRIIGIFDGKIKIIKNEQIEPGKSFVIDRKMGESDSKASMLGTSTSQTGSNDWSDAQLMYLLNGQDIDKLLIATPGYTRTGDLIKDKNGNVIYRLGYSPYYQKTGQSSYSVYATATTWTGLTETAYNQVAETAWYLGGITLDSLNKRWISTEQIYSQERGNEAYYTTIEGTKFQHALRWTGRIALMYASDYGYTFGKGVNDPCYSSPGQCTSEARDNRLEGADPTKSWLSTLGTNFWTITPKRSSPYSWYTYFFGYISEDWNSRQVLPNVYLKPDIKLQGTGSSSDPYTITN